MHILYGFHSVHEAWLNPQRKIEALYMLPNAQKGFEDSLELARQKGLKRPKAIIVDKGKFDKLLPKNAVHQGLAIKCAPLEESDLQDFIIKSHSQDASRLVILDQVTDPHNIGAIIRSACAFGIDGIILQKKHAPILDGVLAKAACGAIEHVPVAYVTNLNRTIEELQDSLFTVFGLDSEAEHDIHITPKNEKLVLILGAEGKGLRQSLRKKCDFMVKLPTSGPIASLNVSNAGAVAFYAMTLDVSKN